MRRAECRASRVLIILSVLALAAGAAARAHAQEPKITQTAGVDNARMGAYRALAQLTYQAFQKDDAATAAELAWVLERTWDQGEWHNTSENSYCKDNRPVCEPIDKSMDVFIKPVMNYANKAPEPATVEAAYNDFLGKLKLAD